MRTNFRSAYNSMNMTACMPCTAQQVTLFRHFSAKIAVNVMILQHNDHRTGGGGSIYKTSQQSFLSFPFFSLHTKVDEGILKLVDFSNSQQLSLHSCEAVHQYDSHARKHGC